MKKMNFVLCFVCAALLVAACGGTSDGYDPTPSSAPAATATAVPSAGEVTYPTTPVISVPPADIHLPPPSGIGSIKPLYPNSIEMVAACGDELVLVNGAANDPCGQVIVVSRYINHDTGKVIDVPSDFNWTIKDQAVAKLVSAPGQEHSASQKFTTAIDALIPQAGSVEPETDVMACTIPLLGVEVEPVCGAIVAKAIINVAGNWFFSGPALGGTGAPVSITQIGRNALVDNSLKGTVNDLTFKFSDSQFEYELVATSSKKMSGTYWATGTTDKIDWFAYRY